MNFPDNLQTFEMSPPRFLTTDAIDVRLQFPMNNEPYDSHSHLAKRARTSENNNPRMMMVNPPNPAMNKGTSHIFFKTRMCVKFKQGACRNGENCNFAHGVEDMRHPPPNWEELVGRRNNDERSSGNWDEDHKIIQKMKICKKFYNGEECPYGDRCSFLHEEPGKFRDDSSVVGFRESSAISIGTNGPPPIICGDGSKSNGSEGVNRGLNNGGLNGSRGVVKSTYWKTKLCIKWETTGHCPFGVDCHFAHGQAELQVPSGRIEAEAVGAISISNPSKATIPTLPNVASSVYLNDAHSNSTASVPQANEDREAKRSLLKWKGLKKINRIYGDWLDDDFPLAENLPGGVES